MPKIILLDKLLLKQADTSFAEAVFQLINRNRNRLEQYMSWTKLINSASDQAQFYEKAVKDWNNDIAYHYVIEIQGSVVGAISVHSISSDRSSCELGFWIDQQFEGKKVISSAIAAIENALIENSFKMIKFRIHRSNTRSVARAKAGGYKLVPELAGVTLDHYLKALTVS